MMEEGRSRKMVNQQVVNQGATIYFSRNYSKWMEARSSSRGTAGT
jgi:hypothetical protein